MGEKVRRLRPAMGASKAGLATTAAGGGGVAASGSPINRERADRVLPILAQILGKELGLGLAELGTLVTAFTIINTLGALIFIGLFLMFWVSFGFSMQESSDAATYSA